MRAAAFLSAIAQKMIELGYSDALEIVGVATGLIDAEKELSRDQMKEVVDRFYYVNVDENDNTELGIALAELIREA